MMRRSLCPAGHFGRICSDQPAEVAPIAGRTGAFPEPYRTESGLARPVQGIKPGRMGANPLLATANGGRNLYLILGTEMRLWQTRERKGRTPSAPKRARATRGRQSQEEGHHRNSFGSWPPEEHFSIPASQKTIKVGTSFKMLPPLFASCQTNSNLFFLSKRPPKTDT